jgi:hypothetical protein
MSETATAGAAANAAVKQQQQQHPDDDDHDPKGSRAVGKKNSSKKVTTTDNTDDIPAAASAALSPASNATTTTADEDASPAESAALLLNTAPSIEVSYQVDRVPEITRFHDHFTLLIPSSTVRYREGHSAARIIESPDCQFVLEETYNAKKEKHSVSIRRIQDASEGVRFLRLSYAIVTAFWTGFFFIFCLQILLFLFLDLAIQAGATSKQGAHWGKAMGTCLSTI